MNRVISDTAEYGCYLFDHAAKPLIKNYINSLEAEVAGKNFGNGYIGVDNQELIAVNDSIRNHPVEKVGAKLRTAMTAMKKIYA